MSTFAAIGFALAYFILLSIVVEMLVVRRKMLSDYQLKIIDFVWVSTSAVTLIFLLLSGREVTLRDRLVSLEQRSASLREYVTTRTRSDTDRCMVGDWPPGAPRPKEASRGARYIYHQNGNFVTAPCRGVSLTAEYVGRFFDIDDPLWRMQPGGATANAFQERFANVFDDRTFIREFRQNSGDDKGPDALAIEARNEYSAQARKIVSWKRQAGVLAAEQTMIHAVVAKSQYGYVWPFLLATALAFRLGKSRLDVLAARRVTTDSGEVACGHQQTLP